MLFLQIVGKTVFFWKFTFGKVLIAIWLMLFYSSTIKYKFFLIYEIVIK